MSSLLKISRLPFVFFCLLFFVSTALAGTVTIQSPADGTAVNSPVHVHATYNGSVTASYMKLWVDHVAGTVQMNTNTFDTTITLSSGKHLVEVQAADPSTSQVYTTPSNFTVATLAVNPPATSLIAGATQQFTASDAAGLSVTWSATGGTISNNGLYTAGATQGTFSVTAKDSSGNPGTAKVVIAPVHTVTIENPANGSTVPSPVLIHATYNGSVVATYMKLWVDHVANLIQRNTNVFDTSIYLAPGPHLIEVQASDPSTGLVYTTGSSMTVSGTILRNYTTWRNDNMRTGQQPNETVLTPANVNATHFGIKFSVPVDGNLFAQPLYLSKISIAGGTHNVVFVATEHDSVYAFDADTAGAPLWKTSLLPAGATTVSQAFVNGTIYPENGITGTPVIDSAAGTIYVVAETLESGNVVFRLHALSVTTGSERAGSPVVITTSGWQPKEQMQRPGLLLANRNVYIAFGSQGDTPPYRGYIFAYSANTLAQVAVWNVTPTGNEGAIWMSGSGISADANGDLFVSTSNGTWDGVKNYADSFVHLSPNLTVLDYFTPYNQATLSAQDKDLGSGGLLLVPTQSGSHPHELIGCGKGPAIYLVDRDVMGHHQTTSDSQIIQTVNNAIGGTTGQQADDHCFTTPAYWQGNLYFVGNNDVMKAFKLDPATGMMSTTPWSKSTFVFNFPGAHPVVSSNGSSNGIVWVMDRPTANGTLHAYSATNLATELYRSPSLGTPTKWAVPTVVNGKVYVGTETKLYVFAPM